MAISQHLVERMIAAAKEASARAYCPYSNFRVGAAVLTEDDAIFTGCNVENASYSLTVCAERNAIFQAVGAGKRAIKAVVVFTPTPRPTSPCGACRQVINEFGPDSEVIGVSDGPDILRLSLSDLLPEAFGPRNLGARPPGD